MLRAIGAKTRAVNGPMAAGCVGQVVEVPTVAVEPKLVNVAVNPLVDDMLQITKFIPGRRGERQLCAGSAVILLCAIVAAIRIKFVDLIIKETLIVLS